MMFKATHASAEHASAIVEILNQAILDRKNAYAAPLEGDAASQWFNDLMKNSIALLVAMDNSGRLMGWGSVTPYRSGRSALAGCAEITFYIHQSFHRQGIGSELIKSLEKEMMLQGITHSIAILLENNHGSAALLRKHGYQQWALFPDIVKFDNLQTGHLYMGKILPNRES